MPKASLRDLPAELKSPSASACNSRRDAFGICTPYVPDEQLRCVWRSKGASEDDLKLTDFRQKFWDLFLQKWDPVKGNAWFIASGWQKRTADLFTVAGEVERKASGK